MRIILAAPTPAQPGDEAVAFARRLLARERATDDTDAGLNRALEQSSLLITGGLSRWFGVYGARALVVRALAVAKKEHPSLAGVEVSDSQCLEGVTSSAELHGSAIVAEGIVVTIAVLAGLLGRLIGDRMAISLLEQSTMTDGAKGESTPPANEHDSPTTKVNRDE